MTTKPEDLTVVLPTLNEEAAIRPVLEELFAAGYRNILVVDGYSTDTTANISRDLGVEVIQQHWHGKTGALKAAFGKVKNQYLLVMDCDGTYDPQDIPKFLTYAENHDHIIGARQVREHIPMLNRVGNKIINLTFNLLTGSSLTDVGSGMYLLRTDVARSLELRTKGVDTEVEIAIQTTSKYQVTEVPIRYRSRLGKAKLSPVRDGMSDIFTIFSLSRAYNPVQFFSMIGTTLILPAGIMILWGSYETFVRGVYHVGWILAGMLFLMFGLSAFGIASMSLMLDRMERRLEMGRRK